MENREKLARKKTVYVYMVADIFHVGHLRYLKKAKTQGDYLIVGVLTDEAAQEKKPKPTIPFEERIEIISSLEMVDEAVTQFTYSPLDNIKKIKPDILLESADHPKMPANEFVKSYGGKVIVFRRPLEPPYDTNRSSNSIKKIIIQEHQQRF